MRGTIVVALLAALLLAGCGDDEEPGPVAPTPSAAETVGVAPAVTASPVPSSSPKPTTAPRVAARKASPTPTPAAPRTSREVPVSTPEPSKSQEEPQPAAPTPDDRYVCPEGSRYRALGVTQTKVENPTIEDCGGPA